MRPCFDAAGCPAWWVQRELQYSYHSRPRHLQVRCTTVGGFAVSGVGAWDDWPLEGARVNNDVSIDMSKANFFKFTNPII